MERGCVATIGAFDGLHLGHVTILEEVARRARRANLWAVVITFEPHPDEVLGTKRPENSVLTSHEEKSQLLAECGIDLEVVLEFTRSVAGMDTSSFVRRYLAGPLELKELVVGHDFRMGKDREGGREVLGSLGRELGFAVTDIEAVLVDGTPVSSTRVREVLRAGDLSLAGRMLGRLYSVEGHVVKGEGLGTKLGLPTANLSPPEGKLLPPDGVYAGYAEVEARTYYAAINIGTRPSVGGKGRRLEAHLVGFDGHLPGRRLRLSFVSRLRPERRFSGLEELRKSIKRDVETAVQLLDKHGTSTSI